MKLKFWEFENSLRILGKLHPWPRVAHLQRKLFMIVTNKLSISAALEWN